MQNAIDFVSSKLGTEKLLNAVELSRYGARPLCCWETSLALRPLVAAFTACLIAILCACPQGARAWGSEGHAIVALIAEHYLQPQVRAKVDKLLASDKSGLTRHDLASAAAWADKYRDSDRDGARVRYEQTHRWHFTDMDLAAPKLDKACYGMPVLSPGTPASAGPARACAVAKIDQFRAELRSAKTPHDERLRALLFLLHLMGDVHQPLHNASDKDAGGNAKEVRADGLPAGTLHHYWDTEFVRLLGSSPVDAAHKLTARITPRQIEEWTRGDASSWSKQSFRLAKNHAYGKLPPRQADGTYSLPPNYIKNARRIVATQLARGGVRLAAVLNAALQ